MSSPACGAVSARGGEAGGRGKGDASPIDASGQSPVASPPARHATRAPGFAFKPTCFHTHLSTRFPGGFTEAEARRVTFPEIPGVVLERVCQYFYYKLQYNDA